MKSRRFYCLMFIKNIVSVIYERRNDSLNSNPSMSENEREGPWRGSSIFS